MKVITDGPSFLTIRSQNSFFADIYANSGDLIENLSSSDLGDTISVTIEDLYGEKTIDYFIKIPVKSKNKYLESLSFSLVSNSHSFH